jgi:tetratricopeptide (TPR) repeat protein
MSGRLAEAIADDTAAIGLDPRRSELFDERGRAYAKGGDLDRAIADFEEALRLDPADVDARGDLGQARAAREPAPAR